MALYFALVTVNQGEDLYTAMVRHYTNLPLPLPDRVNSLLPPIPNAVAWLRLACTGVSLLGTTETGVGPVQLLDTPVEFPGGGGRNSIGLKGIFFDNAVPSVMHVEFMII